MPPATFATLRQILLDLGFAMRVEPGEYVRFDHAASGTWLLYPPFKDGDLVDQGNLVGTRRILDGRGVLAAEEFEKQLQARPVAG